MPRNTSSTHVHADTDALSLPIDLGQTTNSMYVTRTNREKTRFVGRCDCEQAQVCRRCAHMAVGASERLGARNSWLVRCEKVCLVDSQKSCMVVLIGQDAGKCFGTTSSKRSRNDEIGIADHPAGNPTGDWSQSKTFPNEIDNFQGTSMTSFMPGGV